MILRLLPILQLPFSVGGCSLVVANVLDGKGDGDSDGDTDTDTDTDGDCSLEDGAAHGQESGVVINFAGGGENAPLVVDTGDDISRAGADLAVIAKWNGSSSFGFETQLFDERWQNVTGHRRVQDVVEDPQSRGALAGSNDTVFAIFPQIDGASGSIVQVPLTFDAVGESLDPGDRLTIATQDTRLVSVSAVNAGDHLFYLYAGASPEPFGDTSAFAVMADTGAAPVAPPLQLNPGGGHHVSVSGAYSDSQDKLVFVYERVSPGVGDVFYGILDTLPSIVQASRPGISPPGEQSGLPWVAVADDFAVVTFVSRRDESADFDLFWQAIRVSDGALGNSGVVSDMPTNAGVSYVVHHPTLDEFGVAWNEWTEPLGGEQIWAARFATDGTPIQPATLVSEEAGERPVLSMAPVSFGYAIVWDAGLSGLRTGWLGCVPD